MWNLCIVILFCEGLLQINKSRKKDMNLGLRSANSIDTSSIVANYRSTRNSCVRAYNKQTLNRWLKFKTLYHNPKLCETSSTNVKFQLPRDMKANFRELCAKNAAMKF